MDGAQVGQIFYLVLLGTAIVGFTIVSYRGRLGKLAQHGALWALIFLGVVAAIGLWGDIRQTVAPIQRYSGTSIEVPRAMDGHYYLSLRVNGTPVRTMVDTGATDFVLSREDARKAGIDPAELKYLAAAQTANGRVRIAPVQLETVTLGPVEERNFRAWVSEGDMPASLLGMAYLQNFQRIQIENGALILER